MSSLLASLKPYYYYLIGEGIKKIEVRKTYPKADHWDRAVSFYMSKDEKSFAKIPKEFQDKYRKHFGKVGLKFVCDKVYEAKWVRDFEYGNWYWDIRYNPQDDCLTPMELAKYIGDNEIYYGWHISDLVIYDKPKELGEFKKAGFMTEEQWLYNLYPNTHCHYEAWAKRFDIAKPPQSYMLVEELGV